MAGSIFRQHITRHVLAGRRVPAGTPGATKVTSRSRKWYGEIPDPAGGRPLRVPLSTNRAASIQMLAQLIRDQGDPAAAHRRTPLAQHITDHLAEIGGAAKGKRGRPPSPRQIATTGSRLRRVRGYALMAALRYFWRHPEAGVAACRAVEVWLTPTGRGSGSVPFGQATIWSGRADRPAAAPARPAPALAAAPAARPSAGRGAGPSIHQASLA